MDDGEPRELGKVWVVYHHLIIISTVSMNTYVDAMVETGIRTHLHGSASPVPSSQVLFLVVGPLLYLSFSSRQCNHSFKFR